MFLNCVKDQEMVKEGTTTWYLTLTTTTDVLENKIDDDKQLSLEELYAKPITRKRKEKEDKKPITKFKMYNMSGYEEVGAILDSGVSDEEDMSVFFAVDFRERSLNIKNTNFEEHKTIVKDENNNNITNGKLLHKKLEEVKSGGSPRIKQQRTSVRRKKLDDNPVLQVKEHVTITPPTSRRPSAFPLTDATEMPKGTSNEFIISPSAAELNKRFESIWTRFSDFIDSPSSSPSNDNEAIYEEIWGHPKVETMAPQSPIYAELEFENQSNHLPTRISKQFRNSYLDVECVG